MFGYGYRSIHWWPCRLLFDSGKRPSVTLRPLLPWKRPSVTSIAACPTMQKALYELLDLPDATEDAVLIGRQGCFDCQGRGGIFKVEVSRISVRGRPIHLAVCHIALLR